MIEYRTISQAGGPILVVENVGRPKYGEMVEVELADGTVRKGRVLEAMRNRAIVQVFEGTGDVRIGSTKVRFTGRGIELPVSMDILGRIFDGLGAPADKGPKIIPEERVDVNGRPINPTARDYPDDFIETGISAIDGMNTLARGQKLPIFSAYGLPHNELCAQIVRQSKVLSGGNFAVVFAAIGITFEEADYFVSDLRKTGAMERSVVFMNLANDPVIERIATPRMALSAAEYLAFKQGMHVLVVMTDMTNYCEALKEVSAARKEIPGRRGYPGYMYTDLASIYERTGRVRGFKGSITQLPVLSMPEGDITHPIPDLTGYITEGQLVLSRELHMKGVYPPIDVLPSLSRLMHKGIGKGKTREDHAGVSDQLYASYARGKELRELVAIVGEAALTELDRNYLSFADAFEKKFVAQGKYEHRDIEGTLDGAWDLLSSLPKAEMKRIKPEFVEKRKWAK